MSGSLPFSFWRAHALDTRVRRLSLSVLPTLALVFVQSLVGPIVDHWSRWPIKRATAYLQYLYRSCLSMDDLADSAYVDEDLVEVFAQLDQLHTSFFIPTVELYLDVVRVSSALNGAPSESEYQQHGTYSPNTVADRFGSGSWVVAMRELGFEYVFEFGGCQVQTEELRADVQRVAEEIGHCPSSVEYTEHGTYSQRTVALRFGDGLWENAMRELGYEMYRTDTGRIPTEELTADVHRVAEKLGHCPSKEMYTDHGEFSPATVATRLGEGAWPVAMRALGYEYPESNSRTVDVHGHATER